MGKNDLEYMQKMQSHEKLWCYNTGSAEYNTLQPEWNDHIRDK